MYCLIKNKKRRCIFLQRPNESGSLVTCDKHELCRDTQKANKLSFCQQSAISQETAKWKAFIISILILQHWSKIGETESHLSLFILCGKVRGKFLFPLLHCNISPSSQLCFTSLEFSGTEF